MARHTQPSWLQSRLARFRGGKKRKPCANAGVCRRHQHKQKKCSKAREAVSPGILLLEETGLLWFYTAASLMRDELPDAHVTRLGQEPFLNPLPWALHSLPPEREDPVGGGQSHRQVLSFSTRPSNFLDPADRLLSHLPSRLSRTPLRRLSQAQQGSKSARSGREILVLLITGCSGQVISLTHKAFFNLERKRSYYSTFPKRMRRSKLCFWSF